MALIFDSRYMEDLHERYSATGDVVLEKEMLAHSQALIGAIAATMGRSDYDDMFQEGSIKLVDILRSGVYDAKRGSMYSFLSRVFTNHMRSALKGRADWDELDDDMVVAMASIGVAGFDNSLIVDYGMERFATLTHDPYLLRDMMEYAVQAIMESCCDGYRGAVRTMMMLYSLDRAVVSTVYFSMLAVIRMESMGYAWAENVDCALELAGSDGARTSLVPEVILLLGPWIGCVLALVFRGWYIKV